MNKKILILGLCLALMLSTVANAAYAYHCDSCGYGWDCDECGYWVYDDECDYHDPYCSGYSPLVADYSDGSQEFGVLRPVGYSMRTTTADGYELLYDYQYDLQFDAVNVSGVTNQIGLVIDTDVANFLDTFDVVVLKNGYSNTTVMYSNSDLATVYYVDGSTAKWDFDHWHESVCDPDFYNPRYHSFSAETGLGHNFSRVAASYSVVWSNVDIYDDDTGALVYAKDYGSSTPDPEPEPDPECTCTYKCAIDSVDATCEVCASDISGCLGEEQEPEPEPEVYTISFVTGFDDITLPDQTSDSFIVPSVSKEGYTFLGWYLDETLTTQYVASYEFTADTTLYAKWEENAVDYVISFVTGFDDLTIEPQLSSEFVYPTPEYAGFTFKGWYFDSTYTLQYTADYVWTRDTTLYAKWEEVAEPDVVYTISFDTGFDDLTVEPQFTDALAPPTLEKEGYIFLGWYTDSEYNEPWFDGLRFESDSILYAKWAEPSEMESFHQGIFSGLKELLSAKPIVYLLSLIGLVLVIGIFRVYIIPNIT